ncbi:DNA polymerase III subunit gamma/tau [Varunaivibrio sulfuroxidans]|nr:DNA polymerase III subunit gamma/tau [Varunaivibrio sulfuroxidans]WES29681.1 DNA polymerase III subunit gamma/tau [Varunaivibrio sulfuroxidans]
MSDPQNTDHSATTPHLDADAHPPDTQADALKDTPPDVPPKDAPKTNEAYRVLARKYRPTDFDGLIGQQAMVRTLSNAIAAGRLAHAFVLTGVRGVGKTTTARIIARALNCVGPDGAGGATIAPCGVCENCRAIAEDRHVDVMEMDAASRTGVDDIRELIEGVRYRPVVARYKVYIIDEVHMLSKSAFNALLKTLEEPPEHVKFIFATTEIRKVPVTVLSRCQRFDLRRIDIETLSTHFQKIVTSEGASVSPEALHLIARAADGSVRDGLSLLDQAIAHTGGEVGEDQVRDMLGLADRTATFDLFEAVMKGDIAGALNDVAGQYVSGADPLQILEDMLDLTHWLTRIKVTPQAAEGVSVPEAERTRGKALAAGLSMASLARAWQMLLKGLGESRQAPSPMQALEMVLVRLAHSANLPSPADVLRRLDSAPQPAAPASDSKPDTPATPVARTDSDSAPGAVDASIGSTPRTPGARHAVGGGVARAPRSHTDPQSMSELDLPDPLTYQAVVELTETKSEMILHANLVSNVHLVRFEPGRIEFHPGEYADEDLPHKLNKFLNDATRRRWVVTVSREAGQPTLKQQQDAKQAHEKAAAANHPLVRAVIEAFPGASVGAVRKIIPVDAPPSGDVSGDMSDPDENII